MSHHWNHDPPSSEFKRAFSNWQEHVLSSVGLGREVPTVSAVTEKEFEEEKDSEDGGDGDAKDRDSTPKTPKTPSKTPRTGWTGETLEPLELPAASPRPEAAPAPSPMPSPMLEVPATPTPSESPRLKAAPSPMATPMATPAASPMWQPLTEALLPTPQPQPRAEQGAVAPPTPMSIFAEPEAPKGIPLKTPTPSPKPLDVPREDPGSASSASSALLRLLWPSQTSPVPSGEGGDAGESDCVLKTLFRMPDFHDILLEGIGLPRPATEGPEPRGKRKRQEKSKDLLRQEPHAKRYRRIWEILQPPFRRESEMNFSSVAWASSPPKLSRYEKLGQKESLFGVGASSARGTAMLPPQPGAHPGPQQKRKHLVHSEVTRYLWGREVQPLRKKVPKSTSVTATVLPPLGKKRWAGTSPPTAQELSLCSGQPFVLYEYIEEHPTVMMHAGMSHEVLSYFLPRKKSYDGEALGPLQCKTPIQINGPLPHLLGSQIHLKPGQGVSVMDCSVLQAPLVSHEVKGNRFLLVWNRSKRKESGDTDRNKAAELHLRPLSVVCVVGQVEPSRLVPAPSSESKNMRAICIRHMLREVQRRWQKDFSGELEDEDGQLQKAMVRDVSKGVSQWFPDQGPLLQTELRELKVDQIDLSESVCLLEAMRRGEERLQTLGIDNLYQADAPLTKALQELELLERRKNSNGDSFEVLRARWILEQLQVTPWNLASKYATFIKKGTLLAIAGPGDPSNGRLEGVSFLPVLVKHTAESLALSKLCLGADREIVARLKQLGVSQDSFEPLSRWDRIALLCTKLGTELDKNSDCFVTGWSKATLPQAKQTAVELKKKHTQLLQDAFQRQIMALSHPQLTEADHYTGDGRDGKDELKPVNQDDEAALIEALEDSPEKDADAGIKFTPHSEGDDDKMEMQRLRKQLGTDEPSAATSAAASASRAAVPSASAESGPARKDGPAEAAGGKVKMLKIVTITLGKMGQMQERVLYVFGEENIRLYREINAANEAMGSAMGAGRPSFGPGSLKAPKAPRVPSTLSKASKASDQSRSTKRKSDEIDERVSSKDSGLKALDRENLLKRKRSADSTSKISKASRLS